MKRLINKDWVEIYYALDTKLTKIEQGDYSGMEPEGDIEKWRNHILDIIDKIGPDGENMYK